ncbi:hypothetical protein HHI36_008795 [Cryptolaemus montrouzieri]|uniref:C2H2-type domain-containing protein n=1 Tax=Cryptolaemus montrouzieri TaxID=559131 RepID=A0ABD2MUB9_9CUCU
MTPVSAVSPLPAEDDAPSPGPGDIPSPSSPRSVNEGQCRELTPSRCNSKESAESFNRSPSGESMMSERANLLRSASMASAGLSPIGVALPPTLPVAAAAALLPPQSAAMAAYLNAAAAAAVAQQSHRLMMTSPLPPAFNRSSISPLVTSSSSPPGGFNPSISPSERNLQSPPEEILDFSRRGKLSDVESDNDAINFGKSDSPPVEVGNGPLDLSCSGRKRPSDEPAGQVPSRKSRTGEYKSPLAQWPASLGTSHLPYFAAAVAAASNLSPKGSAPPPELWNGKLKHSGASPNDATKALEKMSELSKIGGEDLFRNMPNQPAANAASNRHSAWQSHWLNKGADQAKDVLKCVWCKQSFPSLAAMTTHMKEAKHCGVNVPVPQMQSQSIIPQPQITSPSNTNTSSSSSSANKPISSDLNMLIKETMPLPRKLVRGQDVWLGKGAEQTRQILKCMWCGQSFRSLAEMTSHMQQTQHYTNIISQEQIISWRSTDDNKGGGTGGGGGGNNPPPSGASSHVSAVLTCKVCDQAFSSLKELSNHMVKNSHYKEHIMRSITESGGRRRQTREKRKKSLPVRKLLELERAQHDFKNGDTGILDKMRDPTGAGRITCEKCGHKIETSLFVDHIRQCIGGGSIGTNQRNFLKSALMSNSILPPESPTREKAKPHEKSPSPVSQQRSPLAADLSSKEPSQISENNNGSSPSVLNAIEKLIEKSFDSRTRQNAGYPGHSNNNAPMGSSILKRLGIDESVDYTKPLVDAQTMNLLRSYHQQQQNHFARRERSGSESSSISERGSSHVDSLTPERKMEPPGVPLSNTPRSTPDRREKSPYNDKNECHSDNDIKIKKEIDGEDCPRIEENIMVKKECTDDEDERQSYHSGTRNEDEDKSPTISPKQSVTPGENNQPHSPCRNSASSPTSSDRSGTPRSTNGDKKPGGSLGALSSMFDNLSGTSNENPAPPAGKKGSSHPLAALQKLCDKTETHTNARPHSSSSQSIPNSNPTTVPTNSGTTPGAILAFSWACNDAVMTSDSIMKCAFCDTPFISKGAYRHHLSKMHFVKDGIIPDPVALKSNQPSSSNSVVPLKGTQLPNVPGATSGTKSPPVPPGFEESPHSKFLKYTELAKQLSSKYV